MNTVHLLTPRIRTLVLLAAIALCAPLVWACGEKPGAEGADKTAAKGATAKEAQIAAAPVDVVTVQSQDFEESVDVLATAEPYERAFAASEAPGRIVAANLREGDEVRRGATLYRIDTQLDQARMDLMQNQIDNARREFERLQKLSAEGLGTSQQLDQARMAVDGAELNMRQARVALGKAVVSSPLTGIVATKYSDTGEFAGPGAPLAEIVVLDPLVVRALVPESLVPFLKQGQTVPVDFPALGQSVQGTVYRQALVANGPTRTFPVEIHIPNPERALLPGMRARVKVRKKTWENVVVVPRDAVLEGYAGQEAMVVTNSPEGEVSELRKVRLGPGRADQVVVLEGLAAGEKLITRGHRSIVSGTQVDIIHHHAAKLPEAPAPENGAPAGDALNPENAAEAVEGGKAADSEGATRSN